MLSCEVRADVLEVVVLGIPVKEMLGLPDARKCLGLLQDCGVYPEFFLADDLEHLISDLLQV